MKKLFLRTFFARNELHVVDKEQIDTAVAVSKCGHFVFADGVDKIVGKRFCGDVLYAQIAKPLLYRVTHRVHNVRFAEPGFSVNEQRVVSASRRFGDRERRRVGQIIVRADNKV